MAAIDAIEPILSLVQKPGRYTGGEPNSIVKDKEGKTRFAFCFPDTYEVGMSHLGMKILYSLINEREDAWCERVFAPWMDMEEQMRAHGIPLYALESGDPIRTFDFVGFTMQYELSYTNVLYMLDLAGIPLRTRDRAEEDPIVIIGGPCVCNPEPLADFVDLVSLGEGEEVLNEVLDLYAACKREGKSKAEFLSACAQIDGMYVPSLYQPSNNGGPATPREGSGAPSVICKRIIRDFDHVYYPDKFVVPLIETVHDRAAVEVLRGCLRGCRFCQAGFIYRPLREKKVGTLVRQSRDLCQSSGYEELSLLSLSTSDYSKLNDLLGDLIDWTQKGMINLSLPSLRADNFTEEIAEYLRKVRHSSLTFAPEAGTQRLRDAINKNVTEDEVLNTCKTAFAQGFTSVKLYFMIGLPTETDEDVVGIAQLAQKVVDAFYHMPDKPKGKSVRVSISVATFVPKPFTPFQWEPQNTSEEILRKHKLLRESITSRKISLSYHDNRVSFLEAVLARGDRRLCDVVEEAYRRGCKFDSWDEQFAFDTWMEAFAACKIQPEAYANRLREKDEPLPWDLFDYGVDKAFLWREREKAYQSDTTPHCRIKCAGCGMTKFLGGACSASR